MESYSADPRASTPIGNSQPLIGSTPRETAIRMLAAGLWPIPIYPPGVKRPHNDKLTEGKEPIGTAWGAERNTLDTLAATFKTYRGGGVGVGLGPNRGPGGAWLIDVEGDGPEAEASRLRLFDGEVVDTLGWGSARGGHQLMTADPARVAELLKPLKGLEGKGLKTGVYHLPAFPGLEIRFGGFKPNGVVKQVQSVAPPTIGTDGKPREWNGVATIAPAPEGLYEALRAAAAPTRPIAPPVRQAPVSDRAMPTDDAALAAAALRFLPASDCDEYQPWVETGMSLFKLGQEGLALWDEWSKGSAKYQAGLCQSKWMTFSQDGVKLGSLFHRAEMRGWKPPWKPFTGSVPSTNGNSHTPGKVATLAPAPRFRLTDMGNGERLVHHHGADLRHAHPLGKWYIWDGKRWREDDTAAAVRLAKRAVREIYREAAETSDDTERANLVKWAKVSESKARVEAMLWCAAREASVPVLPEALDLKPWLLNCPNGTVDLKTGELRPHDRANLITRLCQVEYHPEAECPLWLKTLGEIFGGSQALIGFWRRLCGLTLTGVVQEQVLPIPYGAGANGKSTLLGVLLRLLGPDYAMKAPPDLLMVKRTPEHATERAALFGKRLVVAIETGEGARLNEVMVKELTGGDQITARRMREDYWSFWPTHKVFLCTNHRPTVRGTDHAIWRRLKLIPFNVTIASDKQDKALPEKLAAELPGILAWCVRGCLEWQEDGLNPPEEVEAATTQYKQDEDTLGAFLAENCTTAAGDRVKASALFARYKAWSGDDRITQRKFGRAMTERGFERITNDGIWYLGLDLRVEDFA